MSGGESILHSLQLPLLLTALMLLSSAVNQAAPQQQQQQSHQTVLREEFIEQPADVEAAAGEIALLPCKPPRGDPEPRVTWKKDGRALLAGVNNEVEVVSNGGKGGRISTLDDGSLQIRDVRREDEGYYVCMAQNAAGTRESRPARLSVHEKPRILRGPSDVITQENSDAIFQCMSTGYPTPKTTWRKERERSLPVPRSKMLDDNSLRIKKVKSSDEGTYVCRVENRFGWQEAEARLSIHAQPSIVSITRTRSIGVGRRVSFECEATGIPTPTIVWKKENNPMKLSPDVDLGRFSVHDDGTLIIERAHKDDSGDYVCEAQSPAGVAYAKARLDVKDADTRPPPLIHHGPQNQTLPINSMAQLPCTASGGEPAPSIRWYKNGRLLMLAEPRFILLDSGTLQIGELKRADTGWYTCKAISETGETSWGGALIVEPPTDPDVIFRRTPEPSTYPGAPSRPTVTDVRETSVRLTWKANPNNGASHVERFTVEYFSPETGEGWTVATDSVTESNFTIRGLKPNTTYRFIVRARNSHGLSLPSPITTVVRTKAAAPVIVPEDTAGSRITHFLSQIQVYLQPPDSLGPTSAQLRWDVNRRAAAVALGLVTGPSGGGAGGGHQLKTIDGFIVSYRPVSDSERGTMLQMNHGDILQSTLTSAEGAVTTSRPLSRYFTQTISDPESRSLVLKGLHSNTLYIVFVQPFIQNTTGLASNIVYLHTSEDVPSAAPANIQIDRLGNDSVRVTWMPPPKANHNGVITGYKVYLVSNETKFRRDVWVNSSVTELYVHNMNRDVTYEVRIAAHNRVGEGPLSDILLIGPHSVTAADRRAVVTEPWFIAAIIVCSGGAIWLTVCAIVLWLSRCRRRHQQTGKCYINGDVTTRGCAKSELVLHQDAATCQKTTPYDSISADTDNIYENAMSLSRPTPNYIYVGNNVGVPSHVDAYAADATFQMYNGTGGNNFRHPAATGGDPTYPYYSDASVVRPPPVPPSCASLMRLGGGAFTNNNIRQREQFNSWRTGLRDDMATVHHHQQQQQQQQNFARNSFRPIQPPPHASKVDRSYSTCNQRTNNNTAAAVSAFNQAYNGKPLPPARNQLQQPSTRLMSAAVLNTKYDEDVDDGRGCTDGEEMEMADEMAAGLLLSTDDGDCRDGSDDPDKSSGMSAAGGFISWSACPPPQQHPVVTTAVTLRPDDYTLKQPRQRSTASVADQLTTGSDFINGRRMSVEHPLNQPQLQARSSQADAGHRNLFIDENEIASDFTRLHDNNRTDLSVDYMEGSQVLDNSMLARPANNNIRTNYSDDATGENDRSSESARLTVQYMTSSLLPPSPAPEDDDGASCYDDDVTSSTPAMAALS